MLLVEQSLVAVRTNDLVEHSMQPMTKPNSNKFPETPTLKGPSMRRKSGKRPEQKKQEYRKGRSGGRATYL